MLRKRISLWGSIKHHLPFPYISVHSIEEMKHFSWTLVCISLLCDSHFLPAVLHGRISPFPLPLVSSSLLWWGAEEEEEEEAGLGVIVPGGELTKVGHGYSPAPLFPLETPWICTLAVNPTGLCSFSISVLYSFSISAHFSFCLSQRRTFIVASRFSLRLLFPPLPRSVGMIFCWILIQTSFIVSLSPQRLCIQRRVSFSCIV